MSPWLKSDYCAGYRRDGGVVGASATYFDDILECGWQDVSSRTRVSLGRRFGELKVQESFCVHVGMGVSQENEFAVKLAQGGFESNLALLPASP